jgi:hypothetical protein
VSGNQECDKKVEAGSWLRSVRPIASWLQQWQYTHVQKKTGKWSVCDTKDDACHCQVTTAVENMCERAVWMKVPAALVTHLSQGSGQHESKRKPCLLPSERCSMCVNALACQLSQPFSDCPASPPYAIPVPETLRSAAEWTAGG